VSIFYFLFYNEILRSEDGVSMQGKKDIQTQKILIKDIHSPNSRRVILF